MKLEYCVSGITAIDEVARQTAMTRWNMLAKPLGGLGQLEDMVATIAGIVGVPRIDKRAVVVMCADNGVVAEGISQTGQEVTAIVTENMATGGTSVCRMANVANVAVIPVDIGVAIPVFAEGICQCNVRRGTRNMAKEPAMTVDETISAIEVGIQIVSNLAQEGYGLIVTGEMGIGNTTTSAAVSAVLLGVSVEQVTGRGAGLSAEGLSHKISVIEKAIMLHKPNKNNPIEVLSSIGGLDIAGLVGVYLGCAYHGIPVLIDGVISVTAALVATMICPHSKGYMLPSHVSKERGSKLILDALDLNAPLHAGFHLGEGTGAVAMIPLLDMALAVYHELPTFGDIQIEAYQELK